MKFRTGRLIESAKKRIAEEHERAAVGSAEYEKRVSEAREKYVANTNPTWAGIARSILSAVNEGRPVTAEDITATYQSSYGGRFPAFYHQPSCPTRLRDVRQEFVGKLETFISLLEGVTDEEISTNALATHGYRDLRFVLTPIEPPKD